MIYPKHNLRDIPTIRIPRDRKIDTLNCWNGKLVFSTKNAVPGITGPDYGKSKVDGVTISEDTSGPIDDKKNIANKFMGLAKMFDTNKLELNWPRSEVFRLSSNFSVETGAIFKLKYASNKVPETVLVHKKEIEVNNWFADNQGIVMGAIYDFEDKLYRALVDIVDPKFPDIIDATKFEIVGEKRGNYWSVSKTNPSVTNNILRWSWYSNSPSEIVIDSSSNTIAQSIFGANTEIIVRYRYDNRGLFLGHINPYPTAFDQYTSMPMHVYRKVRAPISEFDITADYTDVEHLSIKEGQFTSYVPEKNVKVKGVRLLSTPTNELFWAWVDISL